MSRKGKKRTLGPIERRLRDAVRLAINGQYGARNALAAETHLKPAWITQFLRGQAADVDQAAALMRALKLTVRDLSSDVGLDTETLELRRLWEALPRGEKRRLVVRVVRSLSTDDA